MSSDVAYAGSLTSPPFTPISADESTDPTVTVQGWFEIESVSPTSRDEIIFEYFSPNDPGPGFVEFGRMNPTTASGGQQDLPYSNNGLSATPSFQQFNLALPVGVTRNVANVQVRVRFDSGDGLYQGFRGAGIDNVTLQATPTNLTTDFENGLAPWTSDPAGPAGTPFWQVVGESENVTVKNPEVNPELVTLPDAGGLPATPNGVSLAWFGNGIRHVLRPGLRQHSPPAPETTITSAPPGSRRAPTRRSSSPPPRAASSSASSTAAASSSAGRPTPIPGSRTERTPSRSEPPTSPAAPTPRRRHTHGPSGRPRSRTSTTPRMAST